MYRKLLPILFLLVMFGLAVHLVGSSHLTLATIATLIACCVPAYIDEKRTIESERHHGIHLPRHP